MLSSSGSSNGEDIDGIAIADDAVWYCQFSVLVNAKIFLLSYAPADGLDPAENIPTSDISYLSSVGSSAVNTILFIPDSFTNPLEDIGILNISKSKDCLAEKSPGVSAISNGVGPHPELLWEQTSYELVLGG